MTKTKFDEFVGLDDEARAKALKRCELSDKKKEERWKATKKRQEEYEAKKKERIVEKEKADAKGKGKKRKAEAPIAEQATSNGALKDNSSSFLLTQDRLWHGLPPQVPDLDLVASVD